MNVKQAKKIAGAKAAKRIVAKAKPKKAKVR